MTTPNFDWLLDPPDDGEPPPEDPELADAQDAYFDYLDALEARGSEEPALTFEEFCARAKAATRTTLPAPVEDLGDDDIPF